MSRFSGLLRCFDKPVIKSRLEGQKWYEIDNIQDLDIAESILLRIRMIKWRLQGRFGGYWRYPKF